MARGLPKSYIKKYGVTKKAWREYRKVHPKRGTTRKTRSSRSNPKRKVRKRVARRKRRRKKQGFTIPLAVVGGLAVGMAEPVQMLIQGDIMAAADKIAWHYTGYSTTTGQYFDINGLQRGLIPLIIGGLVHKFVGGSPLNLNRMLAAAGVPFIRI